MNPFVITSLLTALQLNQHWQSQFPFLKLRIYTPEDRLIRGNIPLHKISRKKNGPKWLIVYPTVTIKAFEKLFQTTFGLKAEVLRKAEYRWNNTISTKIKNRFSKI